MAKAGQFGLDAITGSLASASVEAKGPPPVERWNPPFCGDLDMRIAADGTWYYLKTPIGRPALVRLFASVLKREGDKYFLVTPVEKCGILAPFQYFLGEIDAAYDMVTPLSGRAGSVLPGCYSLRPPVCVASSFFEGPQWDASVITGDKHFCQP